MKHNFKNLIIWKEAIKLLSTVYDLYLEFPVEEKFGLTSQIKRAAISIPSNIAEGSSRSSNKDFNRFLEISMGSLFEVQTQLIFVYSRNFISKNNFNQINI
ncbi:four helix bundle protein [Flavobacteriaceae bacterium Ap0902]|nr:four helix bundle protein [Flavobacteriaceae bacterium Ap0902]